MDMIASLPGNIVYQPLETIQIKPDICLLTVQAQGIRRCPDLAGKVFLALSEIPVLLISQSSAAGSLSLAIPCDQMLKALIALEQALHPQLADGTVTALSARRDVVLLTLPTIDEYDALRDRLLTWLAECRINILVTAQGLRSLSLVVETIF